MRVVSKTSSVSNARLDRALALLKSGRHARDTIGMFEGPSEQIFGRVGAIQRTPDGDFAILDSQANRISVFSRDGEFITYFGRSGRGPGEFTNPKDMIIRRNGLVLVADGDFRLLSYRKHGVIYEPSESVKLEYRPEALCVNHPTQLHLHSFNLNRTLRRNVIHTYEGKRLLTSYGEIYETDNPLVYGRLTQGLLECSRSLPDIYYGSLAMGQVWSFKDDGTINWVTRFDDFTQMKVIEIGNGLRQTRSDSKYTNYLLNLTEGPNRSLIVQIVGQTSEDFDNKVDFSVVDTYVLDPWTGEGVYLGNDLGGFILYADDEQMAVAHERPYPFVEIIDLEG